MQKAAVGWLVWQLTHSAAWVGSLAMADVITAVWVGPLAGAVTDRSSPFRMILITQSLLTVHALCLGALVSSHTINVWLLFALSLLESTAQGFNQPVRMTIIGMIAGRERLPQAIASNSIANNLARSIGPAIAGIVMVKSAGSAVYLVNAISYGAMIGAILYLRPWTDRTTSIKGPALLSDIRDGFSYVRRHPQISVLIALALSFSLLARPFTELLPAIAGDIFKGGPQTLSTLMSVQGLGALVGAGFLLKGRNRQMVATTFIAGLAVSLCLLAFTGAQDFKLALVALGLAGAFHVACNIGMQSIAQSYSDDAYKGRVLALYGLIFRAGPSLGAFVIGILSQWVGLRWLLADAAALSAIFVVIISLSARRAYAPVLSPAH
jgi:MFS family permease